MGLTQGMQPIAGYNYGARNWKRVKDVVRLTILCSVIALSIGFLVGMLMPDLAVSLFTRDAELRAISARAFRISVLMFPVVGFQAVVTNFFQCIGRVGKAIFLSLSRQLLFLIPFLLIFPPLWGTDGVWFSMPASDLVSAIVALALFIPLMREFDRMEKESSLQTNQ